jgi:hypothetical protein
MSTERLDISKIYSPARLSRILALKPDKLDADYKSHIVELLRDFEGKCNPEGFIKPGSVKNVEHDQLFTESDRFRGYTRIPVTFTADVCYPTHGDIINCQVKHFNQFGIMAVAGPLNIVVIPSKDTDVGDQMREQILSVEVVSTRFHPDDTQIEVYAKIPGDLPEVADNEEQVGGEETETSSESEASESEESSAEHSTSSDRDSDKEPKTEESEESEDSEASDEEDEEDEEDEGAEETETEEGKEKKTSIVVNFDQEDDDGDKDGGYDFERPRKDEEYDEYESDGDTADVDNPDEDEEDESEEESEEADN